MPSRLMPLTIVLVVLGAISGILLATVGASGSASKGDPAETDGSGGGVAAVCVEGVPDCQDTIVYPDGDLGDDAEQPVTSGDDIAPDDCSAVHNVEGCEPGSSGEDVPNSGDLVDPDECNAVHNIDACSPEELEDLGLEPAAP